MSTEAWSQGRVGNVAHFDQARQRDVDALRSAEVYFLAYLTPADEEGLRRIKWSVAVPFPLDRLLFLREVIESAISAAETPYEPPPEVDVT